MALTAVDPHPALILVDLQKGIVSRPTVHPIDGVLERASALAGAFRANGLPVVLVNASAGAPGRTEAPPRIGVGGRAPDWMEIVEELDPQPGDHRVTKERWGAFYETSLDGLLKELGVTQVFLGGVATSIGVESTARAAYEHGYNVVLATDAMTDLDAGAHRNSVEVIFPRLGETAITAEVLEKIGA